MKKELIIMISLLIIAMFMVSACSSGQAFKDADKKGLDMKLGAKDDGKEFEDVNPNSAPIESGTVEEACTETDDGNDIFNYGVVRFNGEAYEDECGDSTEIKEFYCVSDEEMGVEKQYCPEMTECYRGACEHYCTDSDGGHNYAVQGEVTGWNVGLNQFDTQVDVCNNGFLVEMYCSDAVMSYEFNVTCPNGCENGACLNETTNVTCVDSDGGINVYVKGEVIASGDNYYVQNYLNYGGEINGSYIIFEDYCRDNNIYVPGLEGIVEFYCVDNYGVMPRFQDCPFNCLDGACLEGFVVDIEFENSVDLDDPGNSGVNIYDYQDVIALKLSSETGNVEGGFLINNISTSKIYVMSDDNNLALLAYMDDDGDIIGVEEIASGGQEFQTTVKLIASDDIYLIDWEYFDSSKLNMTFSGLFPGFAQESLIFPNIDLVNQFFGLEDYQTTDLLVREYIDPNYLAIGSYDNSYFTGMGTEIVTPEEHFDDEEARLIIPFEYFGPETATPGDLIIPVLQCNEDYEKILSVEMYSFQGDSYEVTEKFVAEDCRLVNAGTYHDEDFEPGTLTTGSNIDFRIEYVFDPPLEHIHGDTIIDFLGETIEIFDIDVNSVTVSVAEESTLSPGEHINKTIDGTIYIITLGAVNLNSAAITVNNQTEFVSLDEVYHFGDIAIEVRNLLYLPDDPENSLAKLAYAPFHTRRTNSDGDAIVEFGYGDDNNDAEWVWDIEIEGPYWNYVLRSIGARYNQDRDDWDGNFVPLIEGDQIMLPLTDNMLNPIDYPLLTYTALNPDGSITIDITR